MRTLFNHGVTIEELFTNTPEKIINRKWIWFIKNYGSTNSYEDAISDPFKYMLVLVFNKMLDERLRFKLPVNTEAYWDFETIQEEQFIKDRQKGKFQDIDFIGSDFTGYIIRYFFKGKAYQKAFQIYLGGELRRKFIDNINNGIKYYSTKDFTIYDIIDKVYDKFPELTDSETRSIILHGFRRMHSATKYGCALTLNTTKYGNCYAYIGKMSWDKDKQIREYRLRRDRKLRRIEAWKRLPFDGYYYIGLTEKALKEWVLLNKTARNTVKFRNVVPKKIMEELYYRYAKVYIFKIKLKKFKGWAHWAEKIDSKDTTYIGVAERLKFSPANVTWKELVKQYETRNT